MKSGPQTRTGPNQKQAREPRKPSILHLGFEVAILLKGIHVTLEVVGGVLLWFVKPETLGRWIRLLTQNELAEDPKELIANLLVRAG